MFNFFQAIDCLGDECITISTNQFGGMMGGEFLMLGALIIAGAVGLHKMIFKNHPFPKSSQ